MALNNSGPLSLGGSTVGQSINLELGQAATATASINATNFRALAGVPSGTISIFNFYGKANLSYYIALFTAPGQGNNVRGGSVDSAGNVYVGSHNGYADQASYLKITTNGAAIGFQKTVTTAFPNIYETKMIARNDSTTAIVTGQFQGNQARIWFASVNTSTGAIIWQTYINGVAYASNYASINGYYLNSNGDIWGAGAVFATGMLFHLNSSGTNVGSYTMPNIMRGVTADTSGYNYSTFTNRNNERGTIFKMDNSANVVWKIEETNGGNTTGTNNLVWSTTGNLYWVITRYTGSAYNTTLFKINASTGALVWSRRITDNWYMQTLGIDGNDNIYLCGIYTPTNIAGLIKYNSSGTLQWGRTFDCSPGDQEQFTFVKSITNDAIVVGGNYRPVNYPTGIVFCFPSDGSKTGTYTVGGVTCTYASATVTEVAGLSLGTSSQSYTPSALAVETATASPVNYNATLTTTTI